MPESEAKKMWMKENTTQIKLKLTNNTDKDILEKLSTIPNKQGYIKELIRHDILRENKIRHTKKVFNQLSKK